MKVYLAAMYSLKNEVREREKDLKALGIECTSTWLKEPHDPKTGINEVTPEFCRETAHQDLQDILRSDVVVLFTVDGTTPTLRGGRHFESGFAYGVACMSTMNEIANPQLTIRDLKVITVGPRENIFHHIKSILNFPTWQGAMAFLLEQKDYVDRYDAMVARRLANHEITPLLNEIAPEYDPDTKKQN